jgi:hypothetical protein
MTDKWNCSPAVFCGHCQAYGHHVLTHMQHENVVSYAATLEQDLRTAERLLAFWLNPLADDNARFQATRSFLKGKLK